MNKILLVFLCSPTQALHTALLVGTPFTQPFLLLLITCCSDFFFFFYSQAAQQIYLSALMQEKGLSPDVVTYSTLIECFGKIDKIDMHGLHVVEEILAHSHSHSHQMRGRF